MELCCKKSYKEIICFIFMLPQYHFLLGLIVSLFLYFGFDAGVLGCFVFLIATVGIDVDHYLYYVYRKRDWSLVNTVRWFMEKGRILKKMGKKESSKFYTGLCFLHGVEVLILFGILGYFFGNIFYFIVLGFGFHLMLDYIHQARNRNRVDKFSIVYDYFKYGKLKFIGEFEGLGKLPTKDLKK